MGATLIVCFSGHTIEWRMIIEYRRCPVDKYSRRRKCVRRNNKCHYAFLHCPAHSSHTGEHAHHMKVFGADGLHSPSTAYMWLTDHMLHTAACPLRGDYKHTHTLPRNRSCLAAYCILVFDLSRSMSLRSISCTSAQVPVVLS